MSGLEWQTLGREATWARGVQQVDLATVTRVEVGSRYAIAMARIAGLQAGTERLSGREFRTRR